MKLETGRIINQTPATPSAMGVVRDSAALLGWEVLATASLRQYKYIWVNNIILTGNTFKKHLDHPHLSRSWQDLIHEALILQYIADCVKISLRQFKSLCSKRLTNWADNLNLILITRALTLKRSDFTFGIKKSTNYPKLIWLSMPIYHVIRQREDPFNLWRTPSRLIQRN